ncbi:hypothetical protein [Acinetobacter sp. ANC 4173]|uniref:hypothetical protein n=1 Tax=Acinetobacter sp. ANC 4173 TaxID=2529837 RepID=UPI00103C86F0|nr:hypothetical protein [Acinetobacter sp. ANC 4173]TCB77432.1 hypothetical protein E0H94_14665 [Acinetobacter sp. ANC 4173]
MALDYTLPLQVKSPDMMGMLDQGSKLAQFYTQNKTDGELSRIYKEASGDLDKMLEIGKQSPFARYVMPQLQSQKQAQIDAAIKQQKDISEIGKTDSEAFKNNQQGGGFKLENSQKQLSAIQSAVQQAAMTGDKGAAIIGLDAARRVGLIGDNEYSQQYQLLSVMNPEQVKAYAQSVTFANAKDPASLVFTSADNRLDNETSVGNNIRDNTTSENNNVRTTNASIYNTDTNAATADKNREIQQQRLEFDQQQAEIKAGQGEIKEANGKLWIVYKDGTARPAVDQSGTQLTSSKSNPQAQAQNEETMRISRIDTILPEVKKLLPKATGSYAGAGVDFLGNAVGYSTEGSKATAQLKTLAGQLVALQPKMSGPQSDKDVQMYREMAGELADDTKPVETRLAALQMIEQITNKYREINSRSGNQLQQGQIPSSSASNRPALSSFFQ